MYICSTLRGQSTFSLASSLIFFSLRFDHQFTYHPLAMLRRMLLAPQYRLQCSLVQSCQPALAQVFFISTHRIQRTSWPRAIGSKIARGSHHDCLTGKVRP